MSDIIIYGKGKTGKSLYELVQKQGKTARFYDDIDGFSTDKGFTSGSVVILSPGVKLSAKGVLEAKRVGAKIVGELEYCFPLCKGKIISVTGTNGKTTTCEMIFHILNSVGVKSRLLGNGGIPFSSQVLDISRDELVVLESSSFQLTNCSDFSPFVSVLTSLACDHLDYHNGFENYIEAKSNNFINQAADAYAIFNADDDNAMQLSSRCSCRKLLYSLKDTSANAYFNGDSIVIRFDDKETVVKSNFVSKFAKHNASNALAAILLCCVARVNVTDALTALESYTFLPHRLQSVGKLNNIEFVDDSKATNAHATISAVNNYTSPLSLILGGSSKGEPFDCLFERLPSNVVGVVAVGQTANEMAIAGRKYGIEVRVLDSISQAVMYSYELLSLYNEGIVLMSNACASFDKFSGYAERGDCFQKAVRELMREKETD